VTAAPETIRLTAIRRYPVKSCRGHDLDSATVEPWGLAGDRRWMLVDDDGMAVTARQQPRMVLVTPTPREGGMRVTAPGAEPLEVARPTAGPSLGVQVWADKLVATPASGAAHDWFSAAIGVPLRLVYLDDPTQRPTDAKYGLDADRVSFADGYPVLLATEESLAAVGNALSIVRFRPNLVVAGVPAWTEDGWRRLRIGDATFRAVKGCSRCVLTTIDPDTAEKGHEPLRTLATLRRWSGKVWFGVNLVPEAPGAVLHVGDDVEILESVAATEPLR
jgi:uncharacterized protein